MARKPLLLQWNTRSLLHKKEELLRILRMHAADVVAISETWLLSHHHFRVPGYDVLRLDRATGTGGGVALLIKNHRSYLRLNLPPTQVEAVAARITFGGKVISVASIYDPQGDCPMSDYSDIVNQLATRLLSLVILTRSTQRGALPTATGKAGHWSSGWWMTATVAFSTMAALRAFICRQVPDPTWTSRLCPRIYTSGTRGKSYRKELVITSRS